MVAMDSPNLTQAKKVRPETKLTEREKMGETLKKDQFERSEILREIALAFDGVQLGSGISLHQARHIDDNYCDDRSLRVKDPEVSWTELSDEKMRFFSDVFNFLDAEGFRFYVPAFMGWVLRDAGCGLDWSFCFALCGSTDSHGTHERAFQIEERIALLTPVQKQAIRRFIEYETRSDWSREALQAWNHFWRDLTPPSSPR